jgi:DNA-binding NarL/FixJ family response regulator
MVSLEMRPNRNGSRPAVQGTSLKPFYPNGSNGGVRPDSYPSNGSVHALPPGALAPAPRRLIRVLVADPHELFREALLLHLAAQDDLCVAPAVKSSREALSACAGQEIDVLLCADEGATLALSALAAELRSRSPHTRMLLISGDAAPDEEGALRAGTWGPVSRRRGGDHFVRAIRAVAGGQLWAGRDTLCRLARIGLSDPPPPAPKKVRPLLSDREIEIIQLVSAGLTNDRIAEQLFVESSTVRTHLRRIFRKLGVHNRRSAVLAVQFADVIGSRG